MISDDYIGRGNEINSAEKDRKSGRPRVITPPLEQVIAALYKRGYGYRAIARILREEHHVNPDYSSVRRALKRLGLLPRS
jgi:transposase